MKTFKRYYCTHRWTNILHRALGWNFSKLALAKREKVSLHCNAYVDVYLTFPFVSQLYSIKRSKE